MDDDGMKGAWKWRFGFERFLAPAKEAVERYDMGSSIELSNNDEITTLIVVPCFMLDLRPGEWLFRRHMECDIATACLSRCLPDLERLA